MEAFLDDILFISKSLGLHHYLCRGCMLPNYFLFRYVNLFCFVMNVFFICTYYNHMLVCIFIFSSSSLFHCTCGLCYVHTLVVEWRQRRFVLVVLGVWYYLWQEPKVTMDVDFTAALNRRYM
jgi:hypothetical protein